MPDAHDDARDTSTASAPADTHHAVAHQSDAPAPTPAPAATPLQHADTAPAPIAPAAPDASTVQAATVQPTTIAQPTGTQPATPLPTYSAATAYPAEQPALAAAVGTLRNAADGSSELTVALHPADLGTVRVHARLHDGTLDVTVSCADDAAHAAVTAALPVLHQQLADLTNGNGAGTFTLTANTQAQSQAQQQQQQQQTDPSTGRPQIGGQLPNAGDHTPRDRQQQHRHRRDPNSALDQWM